MVNDTKVKHFIVIMPLFVLFERYLSRMAKKGWHLISYGKFRYVFKKAAPATKTYFIYRNSEGFRKDDGKYSLRLRHLNILGTYGLSRQRSRLNSFSGRLEKIPIDIRPKDLLRRPRIQIIEIDENKNRIGLKELYSDRRRLYSMKTVRDFALLLIVFILSELFYSGIIYKILIRIIFSMSLIYTVTTIFSFLFEKSRKKKLI